MGIYIAVACSVLSLIAVVIAIFLLNAQKKSIEALSDTRQNEEIKSQLSSARQELSAISARQDMLIQTNEHAMGKIYAQMQDMTLQNEQKLDNIRRTLTENIAKMQDSNTLQLENIRKTVDEKLQDTLDKKLSDSFKQVSERLEQVYKGLGEMQTLANGVGDLKKVLSNVKTRGVLGEIQLGAILEQMLSPEQYSTNVATKIGSQANVEYAIKLPGDGISPVWLPIDSKFPIDAYEQLLTAYDTADQLQVDAAKKVLFQRVRGFAKDIHDKYIDPPNTTDFAIMFLPTEGLYAELVRGNMIEILQRDFKINLSGPTTMGALLNSLQMGFKTLAIQRRSGEVWKILSAVKGEFDTFGTVLEQAQKRISMANEDLDKLIGTRTRKIQRTLKSIEAEPAAILESQMEDDNA